MTQEDKELILKDLCARLPYGIIVYDYDKEETREMGLGTLYDIMFNDLECKPYLRPISSMTEEETKEFFAIDTGSIRGDLVANVDFYLSHHIDFRLTKDVKTMIELGLALEAPEGMYNL